MGISSITDTPTGVWKMAEESCWGRRGSYDRRFYILHAVSYWFLINTRCIAENGGNRTR